MQLWILDGLFFSSYHFHSLLKTPLKFFMHQQFLFLPEREWKRITWRKFSALVSTTNTKKNQGVHKMWRKWRLKDALRHVLEMDGKIRIQRTVAFLARNIKGKVCNKKSIFFFMTRNCFFSCDYFETFTREITIER